MVKICHLTTVHPRYDTRVFYRECVTLAQQKNYEVYLIVADGKGNEQRSRVNIIDIGRPGSRLERMLKKTTLACQKARKLKCDVVQIHDFELIFCAYKLKRYGIKVIYDIHENRPDQIYHKPYIPDFLKPVLSKLVEKLENFYIKRFDYNFAPDPGTYQRLKNSGIKRIENLRNFALLPNVEKRLSWEEKENAVIYAGTITEERGIWELLELTKYLPDVKLYIAGYFASDELKQKVTSHSQWQKIIYLGYLDKAELDQVTEKVKVGLVPLHKTKMFMSNYPRKIFEYMLAGIPVVANNIPLWQKILDQCQCGISVDITDIKKVAQVVDKLLKDDNFAKQLGENGYKFALEHYNWEKEKQKLLDVYSQIINKN